MLRRVLFMFKLTQDGNMERFAEVFWLTDSLRTE